MITHEELYGDSNINIGRGQGADSFPEIREIQLYIVYIKMIQLLTK